MPKKMILSPKEKKLARRYLMWCYKTTKEDLDRIDRYFTQLQADRCILEVLTNLPEVQRPGHEALKKKVGEFRQYMQTKKENVLSKKFIDEKKDVLQPDYWYLQQRLAALEKTIVSLLGKPALAEIENLYETEMLRRILEAREHT